MHSGRAPLGRLAHWMGVASLAGISASSPLQADPAPAAPANTPAQISSKQGAPGAPTTTRPSEVKDELGLPGRGESMTPGVDIPAPQGMQPGQLQRMDPRMRKKLLEEADRRRNWMFDSKNTAGNAAANAAGKGKVGSEPPKEGGNRAVEFESSRQRGLVEKRTAGDDEESRSEREAREEKRTKDRQKNGRNRDGHSQGEADPDSDPDADLKGDREGRSGSRDGRGSAAHEDRPFQQAVFSDPFTAGRNSADEDSSTRAFGGGNSAGNGLGSRPDSPLGRGGDRLDAILGPAGGSSAPRQENGFLSGFGDSRPSHAQQFNELLGGTDSGAAKTGLMDAGKGPAAARAFGSGAAGGLGNASPFGGAAAPGAAGGFSGSGFSAPAAPRPAAPLLKAQPGVLPLPSRNF